MAQSPYPIRLPGNLRSLLEIEAEKHGQSLASYIVGACWAQLERHGGNGTVVVDGRDRADDLFVPADPTSAADVAAASEASRIARHLPKPDTAALRAICAGEGLRDERTHGAAGDDDHNGFGGDMSAGLPVAEVPICGKTWWEDGEHWECLMDAGHKESKHGLRGMVRRLEQ